MDNKIPSTLEDHTCTAKRDSEIQNTADRPYEAPRNAIEAKVAEIWATVLGVDKVGLQDNFLLLGGESLLAGQVAARLRDHFGIEVSLRSIFVDTLAHISAEISNGLSPVTD